MTFLYCLGLSICIVGIIHFRKYDRRAVALWPIVWSISKLNDLVNAL